MMCNTEIHDIFNNVNNKASTVIKLSSHVFNYPLHKYYSCSTSPARIPHRRISMTRLWRPIAVTWHQSQFCRLMRSRVRIVPNLYRDGRMAGNFPLLQNLHPSALLHGKDYSIFSGQSLDSGVGREAATDTRTSIYSVLLILY